MASNLRKIFSSFVLFVCSVVRSIFLLVAALCRCAKSSVNEYSASYQIRCCLGTVGSPVIKLLQLFRHMWEG